MASSITSFVKVVLLIVLQSATAEPDGRKRALLIGGGIANFTDVAATFSGIIRALKEKVCYWYVYPYSSSSCYFTVMNWFPCGSSGSKA